MKSKIKNDDAVAHRLPEKLEAIAKDFLRDWRNLDTRSEADHLLSELDGAQRSAVIRRAQRLSEKT